MAIKQKRILIILAIIIPVIILLGGLIFFASRTSQTDIIAEKPNGCLGEMPVKNDLQVVELRPGLSFHIDTGADFSTITEHDLAVLDSLGFKYERSFYPVIGRDGRGDVKFETVRYTVTLPLYKWTVEPDSTGESKYECQYSDMNILHNVDFVPSRTGFSVLGIDFLENVKVEFRGNEKMIALYFNTPKGYEHSTPLKPKKTFLNILTLSRRYYIEMMVDGDVNDYFLDTGIQHAFVKRPSDELTPGGKHISNENIQSLRGKYPALVDPDGWLKIGEREGKAKIYYYDNDEENYAVNMFNMFRNRDILLDFPGHTFCFSK